MNNKYKGFSKLELDIIEIALKRDCTGTYFKDKTSVFFKEKINKLLAEIREVKEEL